MGGSAYVDGIEYKEFDNFWFCSFMYDQKLWNSTEQAYHAMKFKDDEYIEHIRQQDRIGMIIYYGNNNQRELKAGFKKTALKLRTKEDCFDNPHVSLMYQVNLEKYRQDSVLRDKLVNTGSARIKFSDSSSYWNKWNGRIHEKIRDQLRKS
jgi:predicted NAD-dependent protein-ADP-ribosyltransferase YbiA (DUF1768 family)